MQEHEEQQITGIERSEAPSQTGKGQAVPEPGYTHDTSSETFRARIVSESERTVQQGVQRMQQREARETPRTRDLGMPTRPHDTPSGLIQQLEKRPPMSRSVAETESFRRIGVLEDREVVKLAAWAALIISLIAIVLVGIYSRKDFGPMYEFQNLEIVQKQIVANVADLKRDTRLEKIKTAVINAQLQLSLYEDYAVAEAMLVKAKEDITAFMDALSVEKKIESKKVLNNIDKALRELRKIRAQEPSELDRTFQSILLDLDNI